MKLESFDFHQLIAYLNLMAYFIVAALTGIGLALAWVSRTLGKQYITKDLPKKGNHNE